MTVVTTRWLSVDQAKVLEEAVIEMATSERVYEQRAEEVVGWFDHAPWFRKAIERRQSPELRAVLKKCRARTRAETIDEQVDVIVRLLERRSIKLSRRQEAALRKKSAKQIVQISAVAATAANASEFARKARLNGRSNGHANGRANGRGNGKG